MRKLENNYLNFWEEEINTSMKLDFYRLYKTGFCTSSYVDILRNTQIRKDVTAAAQCEESAVKTKGN